MSWSASDEDSSHNIYYLTYPGVTPTNSYQLTNAVSGEPITGLRNETTYYFVVTALKDGGESLSSEEVSATPMPALAGIPGNVSVAGGVAAATLSWRWVPDAISYNLYYGRAPGVTTSSEWNIKGIHLTTQTIDELNVPGQYYFIVTAVNPSGEGAPSSELVVTAKPAYKSAAAGYGHSAALRIIESDSALGAGSVWVWGDNSSGQLGTDGSPGESHTAIQATGVYSVTDIAAGWHHSMALRTDASVWNWGLNDHGQLGNNQGTTNAGLAVQAAGLVDITAIAASEKHAVALKEDGTVWAWGFNRQGQLGYPSINCQVPLPYDQVPAWSCSFTPSEVPGITGLVTDIGAGYYHTLAITNDGVIWAWGQADSGQLGDLPPNCPPALQITGDVGAYNDPAYACSTVPIPVAGLAGFATAVAGGWGHTLAILADGTVWAWGKNDYGQLGYNPSDFPDDVDNLTCVQTSAFTFPCRIKPVQVAGLDHITAISAGWDHNMALKNDGTVWSWGRNDTGQLGSGEENSSSNPLPLQVAGLEGVISIAAGAYHSVAVKNDGTVWAWGYNGHGQLGNGATADLPSPVQVLDLPDPIVVVPGM